MIRCVFLLTPGKRRDSLLDWQTLAKGMPWGPLFLLGGGFALADACTVCSASFVVAYYYPAPLII